MPIIKRILKRFKVLTMHLVCLYIYLYILPKYDQVHGCKFIKFISETNKNLVILVKQLIVPGLSHISYNSSTAEGATFAFDRACVVSLSVQISGHRFGLSRDVTLFPAVVERTAHVLHYCLLLRSCASAIGTATASALRAHNRHKLV